jgi:hypothetical protein
MITVLGKINKEIVPLNTSVELFCDAVLLWRFCSVEWYMVGWVERDMETGVTWICKVFYLEGLSKTKGKDLSR